MEPRDAHPIFALSHELVDRISTDSPVAATFTGVAGHNHLWDDFGPEGVTARAATYREFSTRLAAIPPGNRDADLAVRVHREHLDERLEFYASDNPYLDLNHIVSTFQMLTMVFDFMDTSSPAGVEAVAARLEGFPKAAESYRVLLAHALEKGHVVERRQVLAAIKQGRAKTKDDSFAHVIVRGCRAAAGENESLGRRLDRGADGAESALAGLTDWLEASYLPRAPDRDGVGRERYERAARRYLGKTIDPLETYAWGWEEIRTIEKTMRDVAGSIAKGATVREVAARLNADPAAAAAVPEPFIETMRARQEQALSVLEGVHFTVPEPIRKVDIKLAPKGGSVGAYYSPPSEDFSRPGTVWYAPGERTSMPLWPEITTAYHEGFPGHHLQVSMQVFQKDKLTRFQRLFADWPGYSEGWALYAEQLMLELGFFEKPEYVLGMHAAQLARACRVVVDIGLHLGLTIPRDVDFHPGERWTYEIAREMMHERALFDAELAESEIVRYLGWPGQAISYKVGQRAILELRDECRIRAGKSFELARFHADVVGMGGMGLAVLRETLLAAPSR